MNSSAQIHLSSSNDMTVHEPCEIFFLGTYSSSDYKTKNDQEFLV